VQPRDRRLVHQLGTRVRRDHSGAPTRRTSRSNTTPWLRDHADSCHVRRSSASAPIWCGSPARHHHRGPHAPTSAERPVGTRYARAGSEQTTSSALPQTPATQVIHNAGEPRSHRGEGSRRRATRWPPVCSSWWPTTHMAAKTERTRKRCHRGRPRRRKSRIGTTQRPGPVRRCRVTRTPAVREEHLCCGWSRNATGLRKNRRWRRCACYYKRR
jgi:hypothetical protein